MNFFIRGCYPGWDHRMIASALLISNGNDNEDVSTWSDDHLDYFLSQFNLEVFEDRTALWSYTLRIYQDSKHIADIIEAY